MMSDMISRQAIHDIVQARYIEDENSQYDIGYNTAIDDVLEDINYFGFKLGDADDSSNCD